MRSSDAGSPSSISATLEEEWADLASRTGASPFLHPGWIKAWQDAFGRGELKLYVARAAGELTAALPVVSRAGVHSAPANWHTPEFGLLVTGPGPAAEVTDALTRTRARRVDLRGLSTEERDQLERAALGAGRLALAWVQQESPYVDTASGWASYLAGRDARWLRQLERRRSRLAEQGELALELYDGSVGLDGLLEEGFGLEASGWKRETGTAVLAQPQTRRFYWAVARWAVSRNLLRLSFLRLAGRAIAFDFCLETDRRHYFLKTGFDPELRALAPGLILRHDMIERAFSMNLLSYEMLGGAERYKLTWTDTTRARHRCMAFKASLTGRLDWLAQARGRPLAKNVLSKLRPVPSGRSEGRHSRSTVEA